MCMEAMLSYYQIIVFSLSLVWFLIIVIKPELRREMLILGTFSLFLLPLAFTVNEGFGSNAPGAFVELSLMDLIFSFVLAGIAGGIFHTIFGKHYHRLPKIKPMVRTKEPFAQFWFIRLFLAFMVFTWGVVLLSFLFGLNIATATLFSSIVVALYILSSRKDLLIDSLVSALLTGFIVFIAAWIASSFSAIDFTISPISSTSTFLAVPIDLLLWSGAIGLAIGPLYEFIRRFELK